MYNSKLSGNVKTSLSGSIYRFFFVTALTIIFTLGCMWGAINLLLIGLEKSFHGIDYSWELAHVHAMVFGFVGLFIMGFSFQAIPRFTQMTLWKPRLAISILPLMIAGILLQTVAHVMATQPPYLFLGVFAGGLQFIAVLIFATVIIRTLRSAPVRTTSDGFIYSAIGWFLLAAILNPIIFILFEGAATPEEFLYNVSAFNIPYRDIQTLGIAVVMIL